MTDKKSETTPQWARRHLRNGYVILTTRGVVVGSAHRQCREPADLQGGTAMGPIARRTFIAVSYTHLTLPTILLV